MPSPTDDDDTAFPAFNSSVGFDGFGRSHLSPDDAFAPTLPRPYKGIGVGDDRDLRARRLGDRSRSRRRKRGWKKLMWLKQSYPDNYTDQATFLENLQRNPRLKPYDFWPLVADSTVVLQHVCSVVIFVACFVGIYVERVSPVSVVSTSSFGAFLGWLLWERWVSEEEQLGEDANGSAGNTIGRSGSVRRRTRAGSIRRPPPYRAESNVPTAATSTSPSAASSTTNLRNTLRQPRAASTPAIVSPGGSSHAHPQVAARVSHENIPKISLPIPNEESRIHLRLGTIKSAILIYCTLLGLSPILKSLTRSTSEDSIWAMSFWLLAINIFSFDYSGGVGAKFPASLSTNAALMASTVLASRLPSTNQVFSLTLFSIEVFGLFPVFRRHVRHRDWRYHVLLTVLLVLGAGWGVGFVIKKAEETIWPWQRGVAGMLVGVLLAAVATGGCSWWLIGLQKYKNEIRGPWDQARPIIMSRPRWD